jgi:hypothetical protein
LQEYYSSLSLKGVEILLQQMLPSTRKWEYGSNQKEAILRLQNETRSTTIILVDKTLKGNSLSLSQFKGKYILLDF